MRTLESASCANSRELRSKYRKESLRRIWINRDARAEIPGGIKDIGRDTRPGCQRGGNIVRGEHVICRSCQTACAADEEGRAGNSLARNLRRQPSAGNTNDSSAVEGAGVPTQARPKSGQRASGNRSTEAIRAEQLEAVTGGQSAREVRHVECSTQIDRGRFQHVIRRYGFINLHIRIPLQADVVGNGEGADCASATRRNCAAD